MERSFASFAERPTVVESADDWLGGTPDSAGVLDGPVGSSAFPVQMTAADDLMDAPVEDSFA